MGVRGKLTRGISVLAVAALSVTAFAAPLSAQRGDALPAPISGDLPGGDMSVPPFTEAPEYRFDRGASPLLGETIAGPEALDSQSHLLEEFAARNRMSVDRLVHMLDDPTTRLDRDGMLLYVEPVTDLLDHEQGFEGPMSTPAPLDQTFKLNSKPGASRTIYLDFDGHVVSNTVWNTGPHSVPNGFQALPYDTDGNPGSFSAAERTAIQFVWAMVAEDFAPFDVNVTTEYPGEAAITRSGSADQVYGTRLVVTGTPSSEFCGGCGGVAYVGVYNRAWDHAYYQPAWCFAGSLPNVKTVAECASHEVGHNLGLFHDGVHGGSAYYSGHSPWAPIMGVGYSQPVSQWSKGEYTNANNQEDDLVVMASFGIPPRADDHGNTVNSATPIVTFQSGVIISSSDHDAFRYVAPASGTATFTARPAEISPNLDIFLRLFRVDGSNVVQLAQANPTVARVNASTATGLDASITWNVTAGTTYIVQVTGAGHLTPSTGYSGYASIGQYTLKVEGMPGPVGDTFGVVDRTTGIWYLYDFATNQTTSFYYGNPGDYPIMGDWNCDGTDTPGQYRQSDGYVYLRNSNTPGSANVLFYFGNPGDIPIAGDFNGNGCDTVSIYRPSNQTFYIINKLGSKEGGLGAADFSFVFGNPGDKPFTADFDNDGITEVGLHRESTGLVYYRNSLTTGAAHGQFIYGNPGDRIISGRWATNGGAGPETVGLFRPGNGTIYLRHSNSAGAANYTMPYGNSNMWPVSGDFGDLPGGSSVPPG